MSISAIQLDVLKIEACTDEGGCTVASGPMQLDLLELADGKVDFANKVLLPDNTKELRLVLSENNTITAEGISSALTVPSGSTSGLKLKGQQVFSEKGGFLTGITLDFDLEKDLVVQEEKSNSNGKGKGKKASLSDDVVYSFKLKPVIKVETAQVEALPENMAGVVALPGEGVTLTSGDEFSLFIPAGAVSDPTLIFAEKIEYALYKLSPDGQKFNIPVVITMSYASLFYKEAGYEEEDLIIVRNGVEFPSSTDVASKTITASTKEFSWWMVTTFDIPLLSIPYCNKNSDYKLEKIPSIMRDKLKWDTAANLMDHWFIGDRDTNNDLEYSPSVLIDKYSKIKNAFVYLKEKADKNTLFDGIKEYIVDGLKKTPNSNGQFVIPYGGDFNHIKMELDILSAENPWHEEEPYMFYVVDKSIGSDIGLNDYVAAFGTSSARVVASGEVTVDNDIATIHIDKAGIYFRDSYDFTTEQFLGCWSSTPPYVSINSLHFLNPICVCNESFRNYNTRNGKDINRGNFRIFSNPEEYIVETDQYLQYTIPLIVPSSPCTANGKLYCGLTDSLLKSNTLYRCVNGSFLEDTVCATNCRINASGEDDECEDMYTNIEVSPKIATLGDLVVFTVTGSNLSSNLVLSIDDCQNMLALGGTPAVATAAVASMDFAAMAVADADLDGTATSLQFSCTPNSVGLKTGSVDYDNNSYSFTVNVSEAALSCPLGNGYYCGKSSLSQNPNYLYYCQNGIYEEREQCFNGCETMPVGEDDKCSSGTPPQTGGDFIFPFAERESLWQICQGYNTPTISHTSKLIHSFDIAYGSGNLGSTGCWGNIGGSEDKTVIAPAAGTILWNGASDTDITCFQLENSVSNGHGNQIASVKLGHMKSNSARAGAGQYRAQGESIGKLCGPTGCPSAGGYAHTHIGVYTTSDCTGVTVPFGTVFGSGYDFSSDGSLHQWHGTEIPPYGPSPDLPVVNSVSPTNVTLNELTTFTVTGSNLPSVLAFFIEECKDLSPLGGSPTSMQFSCTPSWTIGVKNGVVKDETGGNILYEFTVDVSDDVPEESQTCASGSQVQSWKNRDWQRCDDGNTYLWQEAKDYCDNLVLGGYSDWRLPTKDELKSLVVCTNGTPTPLADSPDEPYGCGNNNGGNDGSYDIPTIDSSFECHPELYWSSTPKEVTDTSPLASKELAWGVYFYYGYAAGKNPNTVHAYVRCIR
ncbi:MAG: DUF1566 domain-containing protein [Candidatus Electrothrix sp. LOE2]|nr:DUF1566 domain-containing protein [Candidatus Electrothrix sp. LOE2]